RVRAWRPDGPLAQPEPDIVKARFGHAATAHGCANAPMFVRPAASAKDPVVGETRRIGIVPAPFPHVAQHVEDSERVGLLETHLLGAVHRVLVRPRDLCHGPVSRAYRSGAAGELPLRLAR